MPKRKTVENPMHVTKRFAVHVDTQLQTSLNARPQAACTFARSVDTAPYLKPPPYYTRVNSCKSRQEDELGEHFRPVSGAKYPISEWPYGENQRAAKARLPVFCTRVVHARLSLRPSAPLAPKKAHLLGTAPRGFSRHNAPTHAHL